MSEIIINKEKACALTGHREIYKDFDKNLVKNTFIELINEGYDTFLIGMAVGFDTEGFKILEGLRKSYPIKLIACIPCEKQDLKFSFWQKLEYKRICASADERILVSKTYTRYCMQLRNEFMVDNSSCLVAYIRKDSGGTANTVRYAQRQGVKIIRV